MITANTTAMEHKKQLEELNKQKLEKKLNIYTKPFLLFCNYFRQFVLQVCINNPKIFENLFIWLEFFTRSGACHKWLLGKLAIILQMIIPFLIICYRNKLIFLPRSSRQ